MKILITDGIEKSGADILLKAGFELTQKTLTPDELLVAIAEFDAIIVRSATKVTKAVIDAGKSLKVIARGGVGVDNIDVEYAKMKGMKVLNTPKASSISVAELTIAHLLALGRFVPMSNIAMRHREWPKKEFSKGIEVTGKTLGIIGFGNIGKEVAKRAMGLMMNVVAYDAYINTSDIPEVKMVSIEELFRTADYVTLHVPFDKAHGPVIAKKDFEKMKNGVILINCARGGVVNERDLLEALNNHKVQYAALDVFEHEPPTPEEFELINHPRVSVTPHIGGSTMEAQDRVGVEIAEKVVAALGAASKQQVLV
ncbi:MAG: D-2-hydroxyacid dehydrogenase [Ignavibacteriae bacterium]|nr:D-2-hydroxyacid dehydrogenase [Ignavibacteriota bacterium]